MGNCCKKAVAPEPIGPTSNQPQVRDGHFVPPAEILPTAEPEALAPLTEILAALGTVTIDVIEKALSASDMGKAAVAIVRVLVQLAENAGAASRNCNKLLDQVMRVMGLLQQAVQRRSLHELVKRILTNELLPILQRAEQLMKEWEAKGRVRKFLTGSKADEEFRELHQDLRDCVQGAMFGQLFLPPMTQQATAGAPGQAAAPPGPGRLPQLQQRLNPADILGPKDDFNSVEANKAAFDRLLLLFILRYQPNPRRTQQQRLMDLLCTYSTGDWADKSVDEKIHHLATRLDHGPKDERTLDVLDSIIEHLWGGNAPGKPRVEKWRVAIRLALEPLRNATGQLMFPETPVEGAQPFD